jgi:hypothetical protein
VRIREASVYELRHFTVSLIGEMDAAREKIAVIEEILGERREIRE